MTLKITWVGRTEKFVPETGTTAKRFTVWLLLLGFVLSFHVLSDVGSHVRLWPAFELAYDDDNEPGEDDRPSAPSAEHFDQHGCPHIDEFCASVEFDLSRLVFIYPVSAKLKSFLWIFPADIPRPPWSS